VHHRRRFLGCLRRSLIRRCVCFVLFFSLALVISLRPFPVEKLVGGSKLTFDESSEQWETLLTFSIFCVEPLSMLDANGSANQKSKHGWCQFYLVLKDSR
jgi:hypothetical protein